MKFRNILLSFIAVAPFTAGAQQIKQSYIDKGATGTNFASSLKNWQKGDKWSEDDNFYISRVRPKVRFRNAATQVNPALTEDVDKKLIFWVPINNETFNALPDGVYDSEVFPMWSYVTHYGDWSAPLIRIPGNFSDIAHKNGVGVSALASTPYGTMQMAWSKCLTELVGIGAEKVADYLEYYGVDGIGYNSEFSTTKDFVSSLTTFHSDLMGLLRKSGRMPLADIIWYDGTNENGQIAFDRGLTSANDDIWGYGDDCRSSLFLNYNWNSSTLLRNAEAYSAQNCQNRTTLDLYCGINMQGKEPKSGSIWPLLAQYKLSIGLWGAHSMNMFYESRAEKGPKPETRQRTYLRRMENWFTGSSRNPVNTPDLNNSLKIAADCEDFPGMSKMMSARSALKWNLSEEPFISYFNLGNGKFFNYKGVRCHNSEWYNIGIQDYLPTWMWWFANSFMGRNPSNVPANGLNAEFVWDDAWMGGSLLRVNGSTDNEYLHLFKTEFPLKNGDIVTLRYKIVNGSADASLVMSAKGSETVESAAGVMSAADPVNCWVEKRLVIGKDFASMTDKEVAMIALNFKNAKDLDIRLGEFSIIRPGVTDKRPDTPVIEKAEILAARHDGADAKIIFNMPNDKGNNVCYNTDVNTSLFKLYAREEGKAPVLMGMTTSWAGLMFSIPVEYAENKKIALGVSALSLDMTKESEIAWSDYAVMDNVYEYSDDIVLSKPVIKPGEKFTVGYADKNHSPADWTLLDSKGKEIAKVSNATEMVFDNGLDTPDNYTVVVKGIVHNGATQEESTRTFAAMVQVTGEESGNIPMLTTADINGSAEDLIKLPAGTKNAEINFTGKNGEATLSRGVRIGSSGTGFKFSDTGLVPNNSFSVSFWLKPDNFKDKAAHLLNIRDKEDKWANNNWGWFWHTVDENGITDAFTMRMNSGGNVNYRFDNTRIVPGVWHHFAYVFDFNSSKKLMVRFFLDGVEQEVTSWTRDDVQQSGAPTHSGATYSWRKNNVVSVGGYLHNSGSATGNLDNLMFWNRSLEASDIETTMGDIDADNLPSGLVSLFDFEKDHDSDLKFTGIGSNPFKGGCHDFLATEIEGQGTLYHVTPEYCAGAPTLKGSAFNLKTDVEFHNQGGTIDNVKGTNEAGSATLRFPVDGVYNAGVTLKNEYGKETREFTIQVGETGIGTINADLVKMTVTPTTFDTHIDVTAHTDGDYRISLTDMNGHRLLVNDFTATTGDRMRICPEVTPGFYILAVEKGGKLYYTAKVIRK